MKTFQPDSIGIWLHQLDVNGLSDAEASSLASFDPTSDDGREKIAREWLRPRFEQWDDQNQSEMLAVLAKSRDWTSAQLDPIYASFQFPGVDVDFDLIVSALRKHFLA